jgi:tetratricopeptide (TPR) repeat protein
MGNSHFSISQFDETLKLKCYERHIEINPNCFSGYFNKANILKNKFLFHTALKFYDGAISKNSNLVAAIYNKATLLEFFKDYANAQESFLSVVKLVPNDYHALFRLGICNLRLGNYIKAISEFEKLHHLEPENIYNYFWLGFSLFLNNSPSGSLRILKK